MKKFNSEHWMKQILASSILLTLLFLTLLPGCKKNSDIGSNQSLILGEWTIKVGKIDGTGEERVITGVFDANNILTLADGETGTYEYDNQTNVVKVRKIKIDGITFRLNEAVVTQNNISKASAHNLDTGSLDDYWYAIR